MVQHHPITFAFVNISRSKSDQSPTTDRFNQTIFKIIIIMKLYGIGGVGTGKLGNQVFAVKAGVQIVRQYQPVVSNPNTEAQVETRSKMKLISQVAAVMAPAIAIPADGLRTKRNMFIKKNYSLLSFLSDKAQVNLPALQITNGVLNMPTMNVSFKDDILEGTFTSDVPLDVDSVAFVVLRQTSDGKLLYDKQGGVQRGDHNFQIQTLVAGGQGDVYTILAYGIRKNTDKARAALGEMTAPNAAAIAQLVSTRQLSENDVTLTQTVGNFTRIPVGA